MKVLHQKQNQTMPRIGIIHFSNKAFMFEFKNSIIQMTSENIDHIYMVFTTEGLFEVAIESWPEWDSNPRPLNSVQTL